MEKKINFIIGVCLLGNLYYLGPLIGLAQEYLIIFFFTISFVFFIKCFSNKIVKLLNFKLAISFTLISIFLFLINILINDYEIRVNDIIRILWYVFFFGWTYSLYDYEKKSLMVLCSKWSIYLLFIILIISFFEYYFYNIFWIFLGGEQRYTENIRLAGTFQDSNTFAGALVIFLYIYLKNNGFTLWGWMYLFIASFLINLSGSRMGLILLSILLINFLINLQLNHFTRKKVIILVISLICIFVTIIFFNSIQIKNREETNTISIVDRFFNESYNYSNENSNIEREQSLRDGLFVGLSANLILPPGNLYFVSKWNKEKKVLHVPHNSILYIFVEYGIYSMIPFYILYLVWRRAKKTNLKSLYILMLIQIFFLPNALYYSSIFFIIFFIDFHFSALAYNKTVSN